VKRSVYIASKLHSNEIDYRHRGLKNYLCFCTKSFILLLNKLCIIVKKPIIPLRVARPKQRAKGISSLELPLTAKIIETTFI
jgi:hypothetical protein